MDEVTGPVIAVALVLCAVFVPVRLHQRHHRPVLPPICPDDRRLDGDLGLQLADAQPGAGGRAAEAARGTAAIGSPCCWTLLLGWFFKLFNWRLHAIDRFYARSGGHRCSASASIVLLVYGGLLYLTYWGLTTCPAGSSRSRTRAICW